MGIYEFIWVSCNFQEPNNLSRLDNGTVTKIRSIVNDMAANGKLKKPGFILYLTIILFIIWVVAVILLLIFAQKFTYAYFVIPVVCLIFPILMGLPEYFFKKSSMLQRGKKYFSSNKSRYDSELSPFQMAVKETLKIKNFPTADGKSNEAISGGLVFYPKGNDYIDAESYGEYSMQADNSRDFSMMSQDYPMQPE